MFLYSFFDYKKNIIGYDGSDMFGLSHIIFMACAFILLIVLCILLRNAKHENVNKYLKVVSIILPILEITKITWETIFDIKTGDNFNWSGLLPLYTCSLFMYTLPFAAWGKGKVKRVALSFLTTVGIFGGMTNFVYLNILNTYPFWTYASLNSVLYHFLMVFTGILILTTKYHEAKIMDVPLSLIPIVIFSVLVIPVNFIIYKYVPGGDWVDYMLYMRGAGMPVIGPMSDFCKQHNILLLYSLFMMTIGYSVVSILVFGIGQGIKKIINIIKK